MFKLLVVCAFIAAAAAKPGVLLSSPISPLTSIVSPEVTTYSNQVGGVVHPSPIFYTSPWAHYIKKRSVQLPISYIAPNTYLTSTPLAATTYTAPFYHTLPLTTTHLIKKRSAPLLSTTYVAPTAFSAAATFVPSTYTATGSVITTPYLTSSPLISQPLTYSTHFIKKRSASAQTAFLTPTSFSHQSRIDLSGYPYVSRYGSPLVYSTSGGAFTHVI